MKASGIHAEDIGASFAQDMHSREAKIFYYTNNVLTQKKDGPLHILFYLYITKLVQPFMEVLKTDTIGKFGVFSDILKPIQRNFLGCH